MLPECEEVGPERRFPSKLCLVCLFLVIGSCTERQPVHRIPGDLPANLSGDLPANLPADRYIHPAEAIVQEAIDSRLVSGAVLLISRNGTVQSIRAFGYASEYGFDGIRLTNPVIMTTTTVFDLASLTKVFATTFGMMILLDRGNVELDAPLNTYLMEFRGTSKDSITVRHLLSHTAGLSPWKPAYFHADSPYAAFEYIRSLTLDFAVGKKRHYSDLGFMLLGYLIERISGQGVDQFVDTELYGPLGLSHTGFVSSIGYDAVQNGPFASTSQGNPFERRMVEDPDFGYLIDEDPTSFTAWRQYTLTGEVNDGNSYYAHGGVAGHAGLFSTATDLNVLLMLLLHGGMFRGKQLISSAVVRQFLTADYTGNGLGWAMSESVLPVDHMPDGAFGHTGFTGTFVFADPGENLVVILLTNRQNRGIDERGNYPSLSALRRAVVSAVTGAAKSTDESR